MSFLRVHSHPIPQPPYPPLIDKYLGYQEKTPHPSKLSCAGRMEPSCTAPMHSFNQLHFHSRIFPSLRIQEPLRRMEKYNTNFPQDPPRPTFPSPALYLPHSLPPILLLLLPPRRPPSTNQIHQTIPFLLLPPIHPFRIPPATKLLPESPQLPRLVFLNVKQPLRRRIPEGGVAGVFR